MTNDASSTARMLRDMRKPAAMLSRTFRRLLVLVLVLVLVCTFVFSPDRAWGDEQDKPAPEARDAFDRGAQAYDRGDFKDALTHFLAAYELSPHPKLLFNIARAADGDAQYERAQEAYEAYVAALPQADNRQFAESRIRKMKELAEHARKDVSAPVAQPTTLPPVQNEQPTLLSSSAESPPRVDRPAPSRPFWKRYWFWGATSAVVAGVVVASVLATRDSSPERTQTSAYWSMPEAKR